MGDNRLERNLYSLKARLIQGEPLHVVAERVELRGHTLRWLLGRIDQSRPYFLLGEVEMPDGRGPAMTGRLDSVDTYNPASYRGGVLRLHYARTPELEPWLDRVAVRGEVVVQFWLKPGEAAVTLGAGEEREVEKIPEQLRRFLGDLRNFRVFYLHNLISRTTFNELHLSQTNRKARKKTLLIKVICLEKRTNKSSAPVGDVDRSPPA